ncbi:MAG: 2-amino-4-hydroxy-6-hydroxymethyldihydropteridine diphosphokinase [Planctomycetaceae bacterium]|nr:2-amino-4-hydroxy-6-hydroxymethyldihydropteridine diphosphokinase [Planctomycetaceae bacterium]
MPTAHVALGSNLGPRQQHLDRAVFSMRHLPHTKLIAQSETYETEPVGPPGQDPYLNAAVALHTTLTPRDLLTHLRHVEQAAGRIRRQRWGPRTLDLDILLYDHLIIDEPHLTVPHPRMHQRDFVLRPLCDIAPDVTHPILKKTIRQLLTECPSP